MLMPKRVKYRKSQRGKVKGTYGSPYKDGKGPAARKHCAPPAARRSRAGDRRRWRRAADGGGRRSGAADQLRLADDDAGLADGGVQL